MLFDQSAGTGSPQVTVTGKLCAQSSGGVVVLLRASSKKKKKKPQAQGLCYSARPSVRVNGRKEIPAGQGSWYRKRMEAALTGGSAAWASWHGNEPYPYRRLRTDRLRTRSEYFRSIRPCKFEETKRVHTVLTKCRQRLI